MNEEPNADTDASSWATVPTDIPSAPRDDASVTSVATFRSTAEATVNRLRELANDQIAQVGHMVNRMAVDTDRPAGQVEIETGVQNDNITRHNLAHNDTITR